MGCHTWFYVPFIIGEENIKKEYSSLLEKFYEHSEDPNELKGLTLDYICDNILNHTIFLEEDNEWIIYQEVSQHSLDEYNKRYNKKIKEYTPEYMSIRHLLEIYHDNLRIAGYPDNVIRNYQQMLEFIQTGFTNETGQHYDFYYDESKKEQFMKDIQTFFKNHPQGIIMFD